MNTTSLVGWTSEPPGRGTLGLLTTCLTTILLCTWVVIHPRVYTHEPHATLHKLSLLAKTLLAPEFIAVEGLQEWAQCRRMVSSVQRPRVTITSDRDSEVVEKTRSKVIWPNR
ncbi:hypothetical protein BJX99DRAFT_254720 [Aspergillus californicus]